MNTTGPQVSNSDTLARSLSWIMLAFLATYLINTVLIHAQGWPGVAAAFSSPFDWRAWAHIAIYAIAVVVAVRFVRRQPRTLRQDAATISAINTYIIRSLFWAVLLIGIVDMAISFLRVEGFLPLLIDEQLAKDLARPQYRGPVVHVPLVILGFVLGAITRTLGFHWFALLIVVAEFAIVVTRFIFSYEQAFMGDLVRFWYAALFLFASAYTLLEEGHVRVDVFYTSMKDRTKGFVNAFGALAFGTTLCWTIIVLGFSGKSSVIYGPLANFEVSQSGFGMYTKYLMAGFLGVFAITMLIQFIAQFLESCADYKKQPGGRQIATDIAH